MSTFLELCQDARRECRIPGTGPTAVTGQVGELARIVSWVKQSYVKIQNKHPNWGWLRSTWIHETSSGNPYIIIDNDNVYDTFAGVYGPISTAGRFGRWWLKQNGYPCTRIYLTSAGVGTETWLHALSWDDFVRTHVIGRNILTAAGMPSVIAIDPSMGGTATGVPRLVMAQTPNAAYTVRGDYQRSAQILAADDDVPEMPSQFHNLIVLETVKRYAVETGSPDLWAGMKDEANQMWGDLRANQLPQGCFAGPLA